MTDAPTEPIASPFPAPAERRTTGSLGRRMIGVATLWIAVLLIGGGGALDRVLVNAVTNNFDSNLEYILYAMIRTAEIDPVGDVRFIEPLGDQRFLEAYSGLYWQISGKGHEPYPSRSLWDRLLKGRPQSGDEVRTYDSTEFNDELLRVAERDVILPGSDVRWRFQVAQDRKTLDEQIRKLRRTLVRSFAILAIGLIIMAALQTLYGLWPLRRIQTSIAQMRRGTRNRVTAPLPNEVMPMVDELNALLAHNELQAEEARRHAGNLAHALKTPLTVVTNAAASHAPDIDETVMREAATMRRHIDHHLARARAVGRRVSGQSRCKAADSIDAVMRAVGRLYPDTRLDSDGPRQMMIDMAAHRRRLTHHGLVDIRGMARGCIGHDGQRRLERVRQIACMAPRLLGLQFIVREQRIEFIDHRHDFVG